MNKALYVRKRDGSLQDFSRDKITSGLEKAFKDAKLSDKGLAKKITSDVEKELFQEFGTIIPRTEDIHDLIQEKLTGKLAPVWKAWMQYRSREKENIGFRTFLGIRDDLGLTPNALKVLARRYLLRNDQGNIIETPARLFRRVAKAIAAADKLYEPKINLKKTEDEFYEAMTLLEFLPNTPTLMNAGTELGQLSACYVLPVGDSLPEIFDAVKYGALIHQSGGGTGYSFSHLRPRGDLIRTTKGNASGPVSFLRIFDTATDVVKQGGKRRGANMAILSCTHPDIIEFCTSKAQTGHLDNFNISVAITDAFLHAVEKDADWQLINPHTKKTVRTVKARELFELIVTYAWRTGDPGIIFIDEINRLNPTASLGMIESTNPCGEQPLHPYESCNLGSINLSKFAKNGKPEWERLRKTIRTAVHFLDNVIDANKYPLPQTEAITKANRRIGLGVMGYAEMLIKLNIPYDSKPALDFADKLMRFVNEEARKMSIEIAAKRGSFPNFPTSTWAKKIKMLRNATVTTVAPTGTISLIAGCSSGIEPLFAVSYIRNVMDGVQLPEVNPAFVSVAKEKGFHSKALLMKIARTGSVQKMPAVPKNIKRLFVTTFDIAPDWHVKTQAAFQKWTDNGVSKTVNLPTNATQVEVKAIYLLAWKLKCKGITIYRYGSKGKTQTLNLAPDIVTADPEYSGGKCEGETCF